MSDSIKFTYAFAAALAIGLVVRFWLGSRQVRHVAKHRTAVPALFSKTLSLAAHQKAADYTFAKVRFGLAEATWSGMVVVGWTLCGGLDLLNRRLLDSLGGGMAHQLALVTAFVAITSLAELPFSLWRSFRLEQKFGFNTMTWSLWLTDAVKGMLVAFELSKNCQLSGVPVAALVLWIMASAGPLWWLWAWGAWTSLNILLLLFYPTFIAPLFNKFSSLDDVALTERVTALMQKCGFKSKGLFVMDGSRRSAHANAYFTGFGAGKRVVFYDTLLQRLTAAEVEAVLAHELGHFKHRHIIKRVALLFMASLAGFASLGWLANQSWMYTGLGVRPNLEASNDAMALLLFMIAVPVFGFFISPLSAILSRHDEFEADAYAVAQSSGADLSTALLKLYYDNASTMTPDPIYTAFYYSHPPASERLARLNGSTAAMA